MVELGLGLATIPVSVTDKSGEQIVRFMTWAQGIVTFTPYSYRGIMSADLVFKLHIILGTTIILLIPLTPLSHIIFGVTRLFGSWDRPNTRDHD